MVLAIYTVGICTVGVCVTIWLVGICIADAIREQTSEFRRLADRASAVEWMGLGVRPPND